MIRKPKPSRAVLERRRVYARRKAAGWKLDPCPRCRSPVFWRRADRHGRVGRGDPICSICHPPPPGPIADEVVLARAVSRETSGPDPTVIVVGLPDPEPKPRRTRDHGPNPFE